MSPYRDKRAGHLAVPAVEAPKVQQQKGKDTGPK